MSYISNAARATAVATGLTLAAGAAHAASIGVGDFSGSENIEDFSSIDVAPSNGSVTFGDVTISENSTGSGFAGWRLISTFDDKVLADNAGISNFTIDFATSYNSVGLDVGIGPAVYAVSFFDTALALLGTVSLDLSAGDIFASGFAGWQDAGGIARISIIETSGENGLVGGIDNIRFENQVIQDADGVVPLPAGLPLLLTGLAGFGALRLRRRKG